MTYFLIGASLILALDCMTRGNLVVMPDATYYLMQCLAYGFAPAAVGYLIAILNWMTGYSRTAQQFTMDRNSGWIIFLAILAAGELLANRAH